MATLPAVVWIGNAAAVLCGDHGDVTAQARAAGCSRQAAYLHADAVLAATPIDLTRVMTLDKPITRVRYDLVQVYGEPLAHLLEPIVLATRTPALVEA